MPTTPHALKRLYYAWRAKHFPWRTKWLVGYDLQGNTFWEFKDAMNSNRNRRIIKYSRWTHYGDVNVGPLWMQWLRHTRFEPPSLAEQQANVVRQQQIKVLAAQADARWASVPSVLDAPVKQQPAQMLESRDPGAGIRQMNVGEEAREQATPTEPIQTDAKEDHIGIVETCRKEIDDAVEDAVQGAPTLKTRRVMREPKPKDSPWQRPGTASASQEWQPESWTPPPARKRAQS
ncbi:hypothetical protein BCR34DRAFT_489283 [Clohesyomyces aquaticus]|uniref:Uncharacterized protein n=1 Tax=Clohesyomyces aquaticus TaxID=1231657 RepID=A0A1Y1ZBI0_9PLEO|nr:hypothetical protein BCR34DRAFT_489283 [Clohesyomyces aquaticus]